MPVKRDPLPRTMATEAIRLALVEIFPEGTAHRNYVIRDIAAKTLFVMIYVGAVEGFGGWFRPAQATLMNDAQADQTDELSRKAWSKESLIGGRLRNVSDRWYATNTREPIRDETLRSGLIPLGAVIERKGIPTTSSQPRYAISRSFYELLLKHHSGSASSSLIDRWRKNHLSAEALARVKLLKTGAMAGLQGGRIQLKFPNGESRLMLNGPSATITKAVVENFAPRFLDQPAILFISDSGEKVVARDEHLAEQLGLKIQVDRNLPDIILIDGAPGREKLVFVEVVATDGAMTPQRKDALAQLAENAKFSANSVFYVTAFADRAKPAFRKLVSELAWDTFAWFAAEPENLICLRASAQFSAEKLLREKRVR
jgi:hypothetical protein